MKTTNWGLPRSLVYLLALQAVVCISIILNIPIFRQTLGFLYLITIPGFLLLRGLKIKTENVLELIIFSVGLSIVFLMIVGLILNSMGELGLVAAPLSTESLVISISVCIFALSIFSIIRKKDDFQLEFSQDFKIIQLIPFISLPILGTIGIMVMKSFNTNFLLILVIAIISSFFVLTSFLKSTTLYPLLLFSIGLTLLLMTFLSSNYLNGYDTHFEYYTFSVTKLASSWNPTIGLADFQSSGWPVYTTNSMLSDTVFPTILSNVLNIDGTYIFNILYPLIFSLVPLCLYQLLQKQWGKKIALLSALFFMANVVFFDYRNNSRQLIAELFYMLLFIVLFKKEFNVRNKWILLAFFGFGLVVSYYSFTFVFLFFIFSTWLCVKIISKRKDLNIKLPMVAFFFVLTFLWYTEVAGAPLNRLGLFFQATISSFQNEFLVASSRGSVVTSVLGLSQAPSLLHQIGRIVFYVAILLILVGFFTMVFRRKKEKYDLENSVLVFLNLIPLTMVIVLPHIAYDFQMDKLYHVTLLFLSPLFVIGGKTLFDAGVKFFSSKKEWSHKSFSLILIVTILIPFFLFQSGLVYEVLNDPVPSSIPLSEYRMDEHTRLSLWLVDENDFFGATWLSNSINKTNSQIYSDTASRYKVLISALLNVNEVESLSNTTVFNGTSYIFLNRYNTQSGILTFEMSSANELNFNVRDISVLSVTTEGTDKVYSNGACETFYYNP